MITINKENIPLISDYLHDALFCPQDFIYDKLNQMFTIKLSRIYYEKPFPGKILLIIPEIRFKKIECEIVFKNISNVEINYLKRNSEKDHYCLLQIGIENGVFILTGEYMSVKVTLVENSNIVVDDVGDPSEKFYFLDFFTKNPWFNRMAEINKLEQD